MEHEPTERPDHGDTGFEDGVGLTLAPLLALAGSGTFAAWTSLTCLVC